MGTVFNGLLLGISGLSLFPLADLFFPKRAEADTIVRVSAALSQPGEKSFSPGGNTPNIALFNEKGDRIGFKSGKGHGNIDEGRFADISVSPIDSKNTELPTYISISASGTDAICISSIAVTPPTNADYFAFLGDTAKACGATWYYSSQPIKTTDESGDIKYYKPACFWIDGPGDNGKTTGNLPQGIGIHLTDFVGNKKRQAQYQAHNEIMCSRPRLHMYDRLDELNCLPVFNPPLKDQNLDADLKEALTDGKVMCHPGPGEKATAEEILHLRKVNLGRIPVPTYGIKHKRGEVTELKERAEKEPRNACFNNDIIISDSMSAKQLCEHPNSRGPDFVSKSEGYYCDMCTHELFPLCRKSPAAKYPKGCFDLASKKIRHVGDIAARGNSMIIPDKNYQNIRNWE
ncbi:uncharacterized protein GIQ15_04513 [Arthroderma uncinatum]|uniref:uncharacterized protein n=1 Tax=Arthroderma uncinatum TaxID=74035 RepID=UPI00144A8A66|nr:uncharacterized protein GIQ15_04513 [Arthroderma uncinatum]KAF3481754.1 hypothetical protein GIQ15_04513 [Arthroderma uncinatum]